MHGWVSNNFIVSKQRARCLLMQTTVANRYRDNVFSGRKIFGNEHELTKLCKMSDKNTSLGMQHTYNMYKDYMNHWTHFSHWHKIIFLMIMTFKRCCEWTIQCYMWCIGMYRICFPASGTCVWKILFKVGVGVKCTFSPTPWMPTSLANIQNRWVTMRQAIVFRGELFSWVPPNCGDVRSRVELRRSWAAHNSVPLRCTHFITVKRCAALWVSARMFAVVCGGGHSVAGHQGVVNTKFVAQGMGLPDINCIVALHYSGRLGNSCKCIIS